MSKNTPETQPQTPPSNPESKPNGFQRVMTKIGNGMKGTVEGLASVVGGVARMPVELVKGAARIGVEFVKGAARIPVELVKGVDTLVSHIPIAGNVYGASKEMVKGVWGIGESLPIVSPIFRGLREGANKVSNAIGFTSQEETVILDKQMEFLLGQKKDFIDKGKIDEILKKNPELQSHFDEYFNNIEDMKTGKENMSVADLLKDGENLKKQISEELSKVKGEKKGDVFQNEYLDFKKAFPSLPDFPTLQKNGPQYSLLQNMYFGRTPRPDLTNPVVKEFMQKSLDIYFPGNNTDDRNAALIQKNRFALQNAAAIADGFAMSPLERKVMEGEINRIEKGKRMPPTMPYNYIGDDYGLRDDANNARDMLSFANNTKIDIYQGTLLNIFQGGGH